MERSVISLTCDMSGMGSSAPRSQGLAAAAPGLAPAPAPKAAIRSLGSPPPPPLVLAPGENGSSAMWRCKVFPEYGSTGLTFGGGRVCVVCRAPGVVVAVAAPGGCGLSPRRAPRVARGLGAGGRRRARAREHQRGAAAGRHTHAPDAAPRVGDRGARDDRPHPAPRVRPRPRPRPGRARLCNR